MATLNDAILSAALEYASYGWRVVPVDVRTKHPPINGWQNVATTDEEQIAAWWQGRYRECGVFVVFGPASGVIDLDLDNLEHDAALRDAFGGTIPVTPTFISGTKKTPHRLFKFREDLPDKANINLREHGIGIDADLKIGHGGKGSGSVFPPSGQYAWLPGLEPSRCDVAELPDQFVAWLHNSLVGCGNANKAATTRKPSIRKKLYQCKVIPEGQRDETIYAEACALWREQGILHGAGAFDAPECEVTVFERLWAFNKAKCQPPLDDAVVRTKCDGARQFIARQVTHKDDTPKLTRLGLEFRDGEWFPGEWRVEIVRCDPRQVRLYAPFLPKTLVEMPLDQFDSPHGVHKAVLADTGIVCLDYKPGFWPGVWNGAKTKDHATGKPKTTTGLKAKLLREATWIEAPPEEQREAVIAQRVLDSLNRAGPPRNNFDISDTTVPVRDAEGAIWFRFIPLFEVVSTNEDKVGRNELSRCLAKFAEQKKVRSGERTTRLFRVTPDGKRLLEVLAHGETHEAESK